MGRTFLNIFPNMSFQPNADGVNEENVDSISRGIWSSMEIAGFEVIETNDPDNHLSLNSATEVLFQASLAVDDLAEDQPWRVWMKVGGNYRIDGVRYRNTGLSMKVGAADLLPFMAASTHHQSVSNMAIVPPFINAASSDTLTENTGPRVGSFEEYPSLGSNRDMSFFLTTTNRGMALSVGMTNHTNRFTRWAFVVIQRPVNDFAEIPDTKIKPLVLFTNVSVLGTGDNPDLEGQYAGPANAWFVQTIVSHDSRLPTPGWAYTGRTYGSRNVLTTQVSLGGLNTTMEPVPIRWNTPVVTDLQQYLIVFPTSYNIGDTVTQYELDMIGISKATVFHEGQYVEPIVFNQNRGYTAVASNYQNSSDPIIVFHLQNAPDIF